MTFEGQHESISSFQVHALHLTVKEVLVDGLVGRCFLLFQNLEEIDSRIRQSRSSQLRSLTISTGNLSFAPDTFYYTVLVPYSTAEVTLTPTLWRYSPGLHIQV